MSNIEILCSYSKLVDVQKLKPNPKNRNLHPQEQIEKLVKIIAAHGFRRPIIVSNQSGNIVSGHGRYLAALKLGMEKVPVDFQDYASPEIEYQDAIADNAIALQAELDYEAVAIDLSVDYKSVDRDVLGIKSVNLSFNTSPLVTTKASEESHKANEVKEKKYFLEVECPDEQTQREVYESLLSQGLIVRVK